MSRKILTATTARQFKPEARVREIPDGATPGLRLVIYPSGKRSWVMRFRRPGTKNTTAKLTLGTADLTGAECETEPAIGGHLTLAAARRLAAEVNRQRALGRDPAADRAAEKKRTHTAASERATNTFGAAARSFIAEHAQPNTRRWQATAVMLGLRAVGDGPLEVIPGGLTERWADRPIKDITAHDIHDVLTQCRKTGLPAHLSPHFL